MNDQTPSLRIGYLPFYVDYYEGICADFPKEKMENAELCAIELKRHGVLIWDGRLIQDIEAAEEAGRNLAREGIDCVVVFTTIAVFGGISWAALKHLSTPILIWNAQSIDRVGKGYSMVEIVRNTSQIGSQALANTLLREGRWFRVVTGYINNHRTADDLNRFFGVIRAVTAFKKARLLAIGEIFPLMTDILIDENALARRIGTTVNRIGNDELTRRYQTIPDADVEKAVGEMKNLHEVVELTEEEARRSNRLCLTLDSFVKEHKADAGTLNCHGGSCLRNPEIGITACYSLGVQNAEGRPFTCTGDLPTAIAMLLLKKLTGIAMYTEVQVMDEERGAVVIANSGEGEDGIRRKNSPSTVMGNTNFTGTHGRGASFVYPLEPGSATMVSFTPANESYRLIVAEGEILEEPLPDAGALAGFFRFKDQDLHTGYTRWLEAGVVHHAATTLGHWGRELKQAADLLDIEFIGI